MQIGQAGGEAGWWEAGSQAAVPAWCVGCFEQVTSPDPSFPSECSSLCTVPSESPEQGRWCLQPCRTSARFLHGHQCGARPPEAMSPGCRQCAGSAPLSSRVAGHAAHCGGGWTGSRALLGARFFPGRLRSLFSFIPPVPLHPPSSVILVPFPKGNKVNSNTVPTRKAKAPPPPFSFLFWVQGNVSHDKTSTNPCTKCFAFLPFSLKGESFSRVPRAITPSH